MSNHNPEEVARLQKEIEESNRGTGSLTAEQVQAQAEAEHRRLQQERLGYAADPPSKPMADLVLLRQPMKFIHNPKAAKMVIEAEETGEPLFCFRARDFFSIQVLAHYAHIVEMYGPDDPDFMVHIVDALGEFKDWQKANITEVRYPD